MDVERLVIGTPFYVIILIVLVASLYPAAVALDRRRVRLAVVLAMVGIVIHGAYLFAVDRFARGYDGMALLLVWPVAAVALSVVISLVVRKAATLRASVRART